MIEENKRLKIGTIVRLKSGGPKMTVVEDCRDPIDALVECGWFDGGTYSGRRWFPTLALDVVEKFEE